MAAGDSLSQAKPLIPPGDLGQLDLPGPRLFILQEGGGLARLAARRSGGNLGGWPFWWHAPPGRGLPWGWYGPGWCSRQLPRGSGRQPRWCASCGGAARGRWRGVGSPAWHRSALCLASALAPLTAAARARPPAGEMRALRPGEAPASGQRSYLGSRVDFCGPAIIGLTALFAAGGDPPPEVQDGAEPGAGAPDVSGDAAGAPGAAGERAGSRDTSGSASDDASSSSDAEAGKQGQRRGRGSRLGPTWQQDAVALTECHLWWVTLACGSGAGCLPGTPARSGHPSAALCSAPAARSVPVEVAF